MVMGILFLVVSMKIVRRIRSSDWESDSDEDEDWRASIPEMEWGDPENPETPDHDEDWH